MLTKKELEKISAHKYAPGTYTVLDGVMNKLVWEPVITNLTPLWMAPNLITLLGTIIILASTGYALFQCPTFTETPSTSVSLILAVADFLYQTLDAIDGKQARRTGSSSPLGQLFDHGCDCIVAGAFVIQLLISTQAGSGITGLVIMTATSLGFFITNHEEKYTGTLRTALGEFGVTEVQLITIFIHLDTAYFGSSIWSYLIPGLNVLTFRTLLFLSVLIFTVLGTVSSLTKLAMRGELLDAVVEWPPVVLTVAAAFAISDGPALAACLAVNLQLTLASVNMIVTTVSGRQFPKFFFFSQLPLLVTAAANYLELLNPSELKTALIVSASVSAAELLTFCVRVAWTISDHLGIQIFRLGKKPKRN